MASIILLIIWLLALAWTALTTLAVIALRPDQVASRIERLSRLWPLTGAVPLALLTIALAKACPVFACATDC
ncbi:hypothetical protein [Novosphingobium capsulatum]|uniref:hypothetical protein n=1 Tax=Novosphingobium capsulatum TaxID=13688 RepID=UPI00078934DB|nr:hypothetical protein [Novosphingobium capsulatum]WQD92776.1 hypothetical protein U0041_17605 [Novosphingobium capsulatum]